ncbi:MAG: hypothetical protein LBV44_02390 [Methylobacillus sp.]|jgi:hypothetical protein|nr:hypothetical protein [Methylobacillus sp.]
MRKFSLLISGCLFATVVCAQSSGAAEADADRFVERQSVSEATAQIKRWLTADTTFADGMNILESRGFQCETKTPPQNAHSAATCIYPRPDQTQSTTPRKIYWHVTLESADGEAITRIQVAY